MQYSFDYCQQVSLPYSSQQCGTFYFKTSHKVQVFGMCCEPLSHQVFFLNQEAEQVADNCVGQNKNTTMLWYLAWRVVTGQHDRIQLHLGLFKKYYCRKDHADNMADLTNCVRQCGQNVTCVLQLCKDWQFYDWNAFLGQWFGPLVGFGRYHTFVFDREHPCVVKLKLMPTDSDQDATEMSILKTGVTVQLFRMPISA